MHEHLLGVLHCLPRPVCPKTSENTKYHNPMNWLIFPFQKLYYVKEVHSIFVTGLDFMPMSDNAKAISDNQDFTLLSISADNTVRVHQEPTRSRW